MRARILSLSAVLLASASVPVLGASFKVDPVHSSVTFMVKHMNASYAMGRFNAISGSFDLDEANPSASKFDFTLKTDSIDTADAKRDAHLKNADFFNAKQFPTIGFKSKTVKAGAEKGTFDVTGDMTLHGVTKEITVKIQHVGTAKSQFGTVAGVFSTFTIKRSDFGMKGMLNMLGDEVTVTVSVEGGLK